MGAEIFEISKDNFRKKLSRTRKKFHAFMNNQCGLVNLNSPCRCSKKGKAMEAAGKMQVDKRLFNAECTATISKYAESVADEVDRKYIEFFHSHPTKENFNKETVINELVNDKKYQKYFDGISMN